MMKELGNKLRKTTLIVNKDWASIEEPHHRERLLLIADVNCPDAEDFFKMVRSTSNVIYSIVHLI